MQVQAPISSSTFQTLNGKYNYQLVKKLYSLPRTQFLRLQRGWATSAVSPLHLQRGLQPLCFLCLRADLLLLPRTRPPQLTPHRVWVWHAPTVRGAPDTSAARDQTSLSPRLQVESGGLVSGKLFCRELTETTTPVAAPFPISPRHPTLKTHVGSSLLPGDAPN